MSPVREFRVTLDPMPASLADCFVRAQQILEGPGGPAGSLGPFLELKDVVVAEAGAILRCLPDGRGFQFHLSYPGSLPPSELALMSRDLPDSDPDAECALEVCEAYLSLTVAERLVQVHCDADRRTRLAVFRVFLTDLSVLASERSNRLFRHVRRKLAEPDWELQLGGGRITLIPDNWEHTPDGRGEYTQLGARFTDINQALAFWEATVRSASERREIRKIDLWVPGSKDDMRRWMETVQLPEAAIAFGCNGAARGEYEEACWQNFLRGRPPHAGGVTPAGDLLPADAALKSARLLDSMSGYQWAIYRWTHVDWEGRGRVGHPWDQLRVVRESPRKSPYLEVHVADSMELGTTVRRLRQEVGLELRRT